MRIASFARPVRHLVAATVIATLLVGAGVAAPPRDTATTAATTRTVTCHAYNWHAADPQTSTRMLGSRIVLDNENGDQFVFCDPGLPSGAVVTKVQFTLHDANSGASTAFCGLYRSSLKANGSSTAQEVAKVPDSGIGAFSGRVRLADTTITNGTVSGEFGYWLQCRLANTFLFGEIGLYGATVTYRL